VYSERYFVLDSGKATIAIASAVRAGTVGQHSAAVRFRQAIVSQLSPLYCKIIWLATAVHATTCIAMDFRRTFGTGASHV
jgi:hypothetical protein